MRASRGGFPSRDGFPRERIIQDRRPAEAIRFLARLIAGGGGYDLCGVAGWAHRIDVETATRMRMDGELPRLHAMRLVDRVNVGPPSMSKEAWVYRVNDAGARAAADTWGDAYERIRVPGELENGHGVYLAPARRQALVLLRLAYETRDRELFGGRGWLTGRELTGFVEEHFRSGNPQCSCPRIDSMELVGLASAQLVEKRDEQFAWGRERPVVFWRISDAGRALRLLEWRPPVVATDGPE